MEALALALDLGVGKVMVAIDCLEVVQGIQGKNLGHFSHILRELSATASNHGGISFRHERRMANVEAHRLARLGTTLDVGRHVWFMNQPQGLALPVNFFDM
jgi:hypothetical protein